MERLLKPAVSQASFISRIRQRRVPSCSSHQRGPSWIEWWGPWRERVFNSPGFRNILRIAPWGCVEGREPSTPKDKRAFLALKVLVGEGVSFRLCASSHKMGRNQIKNSFNSRSSWAYVSGRRCPCMYKEEEVLRPWKLPCQLCVQRAEGMM